MFSTLLRAYGEMLHLKPEQRVRLQPAMANIRDELSIIMGMDPEEVQNFCEAAATALRKENVG